MSSSIEEPLKVFIQRLPDKILREFARRHRLAYDLKISLSREKLIKQILRKIPERVIAEDLYAAYGWAGDITIHFFSFTQSKLNSVSSESTLQTIVKQSLPYIYNRSKPPTLTRTPQPFRVTFTDQNGRQVRIRHEFLGERIIYQDPITRKLKSCKPLMTAFSIIHLPTGFTEVRVRQRKDAWNVVKVLKGYFGGELKELRFTRDHIGKWIDWARTLRNARFKPLGPISTLYMSAKEWIDLRRIEMFRDFWEKGEPLEGIYIKFEFSPKEELGFGVNAKIGKIMFRTFASEEEIDFVIKGAEQILGI